MLDKEKKIIIPKWGFIQAISRGFAIYYNGKTYILSKKKAKRFLKFTLERNSPPTETYKETFKNSAGSLERLWKHRTKKIVYNIIKNVLGTDIPIDIDSIFKNVNEIFPIVRKEKILLTDVVVFFLYEYLNTILPMNPIRYLREIGRKTKYKVTWGKFIKLKSIVNRYSGYRNENILTYAKQIITMIPINPEKKEKILDQMHLLLINKIHKNISRLSPKVAAAVLVYLASKHLSSRISARIIEEASGVSRFTILRYARKLMSQ